MSYTIPPAAFPIDALVDHVLQTSLFPLQHYVQCRGAILEALYRNRGILVQFLRARHDLMLHFEEKVHRKDLARAEAFPLLMLRLLSQVLEHLGFPEEPRLGWRIICTQILSTERSLYMPLSIIMQQQEEAADDVVEDAPRPEQPVPEMEVERTSAPDSPPPVPPLTTPTAPETAGPSSTSQQ